MACNNCKDCAQYLKAQCIIYNGDKLWWETVGTRDGSARYLDDILEQLPDCCDDLSSYIVTADYELQEGDENKILLLQGEDTTEFSTDTVSYTITLPEDEAFIGKLIRIKNISSLDQFGNEMQWNFDQSIKYDWEDNLSSTSFKVLAGSLHKMLWLTYVKTADNVYSWIAISPNTEDIEAIQDDITDIQNQLTILECSAQTEVVFSGVTMVNNYLPYTGSTVIASKLCNHIQLRGQVSAGDNLSTAFTLPVGWRPGQDETFVCAYDESPWQANINVLTSGTVQISVPGIGAIPLSGGVSLTCVSYYLDP